MVDRWERKVTSKLFRFLLSELGWYWENQIYRSPIAVISHCIEYHKAVRE